MQQLPRPHAHQHVVHLCTALCALLLSTGAPAQQSAAEQRYQQEMAACNSGRSQQDAATCRREAASALAEARKNQLTAPQASADAATQRCNALPANQQTECIARMRNGAVQGSVEGGGVLRELTTPQRIVVP